MSDTDSSDIYEYILQNHHQKSPRTEQYQCMLVTIPITLIKQLLTNNYRFATEKKELTQNMRLTGMLQDPVLSLNLETGITTLIDGEHRLISAIKAELSEVQFSVYINLTKEEYLGMQISSNAHKKSIPFFEISEKIAILQEKKPDISLEDIARLVKLTTKTVEKYLLFETLPETIKQEYRDGAANIPLDALIFAQKTLPEDKLRTFYERASEENKTRIGDKQRKKLTQAELKRKVRRLAYQDDESLVMKIQKEFPREKKVRKENQETIRRLREFISLYETTAHLAEILPESQIIQEKVKKIREKTLKRLEERIQTYTGFKPEKFRQGFEKIGGLQAQTSGLKELFKKYSTPKTEYIPIDHIQEGENIRKTINTSELEELCQSIREHGQIQSAIVNRREDGTYEVVTGQRRFKAILENNKSEEKRITYFKAKVYEGLSELEKYVLQIAEDIHKPDTKLERATRLYQLYELKKEREPNYTKEQFLEENNLLGIKDRIKEFEFNFLDETLKKLVTTKIISFDRAFKIAEELKPLEEHQEQNTTALKNEILYNIVTKKMSDRKIKTYVQDKVKELNQTTLFAVKNDYSKILQMLDHEYERFFSYLENNIKKGNTRIFNRQPLYDSLAKVYLVLENKDE